MGDNFFGFNVELPRPNVLGRQVINDELLTFDVEEEFDALNDETFGSANNEDWEEAHEKLAELIKKNNLGEESFFNDSHLDNDESQNEIVSKSISQLGLEDDLDDPAIMTFSHSSISRNSRSTFNSSPPPPAILETEICGSPKTYSIWSTTPKDSGISTFLQSIGHNSGNHLYETSTPLKSGNDSVFITPPKAWRAEELERDLLSSSSQVQSPTNDWSPLSRPSNRNISPISRLTAVDQSQNKVLSSVSKPPINENLERLLRPEAGKPLHSNMPPCSMMPVMRHLPQQNILSHLGSSGNALNGLTHPSVLPFQSIRGPIMGNARPAGVDPLLIQRRNNAFHYPLIRPSMPNFPPGFNPSLMNVHSPKFVNYNMPPRPIAHPLLHKQVQFPMYFHSNQFTNEDSIYNGQSEDEDEYAGLMTQKEREWLIRIQLLQLKAENPYVEDYYYTTQVARRCQKKFSENASTNTGDAPELILPETTKQENRAFIPIQFEGSLGKLQAVSVNFPRKILDITVTRSLDDEEDKTATNQSLMKYRRLLIDIEKLFCSFLQIEDEERKILAKPDFSSAPHQMIIEKLKKSIFIGLSCDNSSDENFLNIMSVRKGRNLLMRVLKIFNLTQQLSCLLLLFRYLPSILKKDQNDLVLLQNIKLITDIIIKLSMPNLIQLAECLDSNTSTVSKGKECSSFTSCFKHKFSSTVICTIILQVEKYIDSDSLQSDLLTEWSSIAVRIADCLCSLPASSVCAPLNTNLNLTNHFQRFLSGTDQLTKLEEHLTVLNAKVDGKSDIVLHSISYNDADLNYKLKHLEG